MGHFNGKIGNAHAGLDWPLCRGTMAFDELRRTQAPPGPFYIF